MMLQFPIRRLAAPAVTAVLLALVVPGLVAAHAELDTPTPADKSTVTTPVTEVSGTFTQGVKVDGSKLLVKDVTGATVAQGGRDPGDNKRMVATPATPLGSGNYLVEWTTISADDDELARGTWTFTVTVAPSPSPTPAATAAASATAAATPSAAPSAASSTAHPTLAPSPTPSAGGTTSGSGSDVILPIIIALVVLGAGAAYLFSRRDRPAAGA
jgi:methionine-rich copper-binding protein CopC